MFGCHLNQTGTMTPERADGADCSRRTKAAAQETNRMQVLNPLAVGYVGLPPRNIFYMMCIHQVNFIPAKFQDLKHRNPVNARRFHRHRSNSTALKPSASALRSCV